MPQVDKIKRAITWIRRALRVTEQTTTPGEVSGLILPTVDALGWERFENDVQSASSFSVNVNATQTPLVPEGVLRLILDASVETTNDVIGFTLWIEVQQPGELPIGVMRPFDTPISPGITIRGGIEKTIIMSPGDTLRGRCTPVTGVGSDLVIRTRFIDLPIGEYVRGF